MKLIAGLGNPGTQFARTRHNVGWLVLDELARRAGVPWSKATNAETAELRLGTEKVLLVKPQTMMNASGRAVQPLMAYFRLEPADLLVAQDDLDSPFGLLRLRHGGRHGGQNGVRDIIARLGEEGFDRLKIGISRPPAGRNPADWVLSRWAEDEATTLAQLVTLGADAATLWATQGLAEAQGRYNGTDLRPAPPSPPAPAVQAVTPAAAPGRSDPEPSA
ncbi:aminoacyl-tRNA hydrolase [Deinococcus aquiradiocola]|uniref:Peptidyl-tRNA hydrolase n=1 Tax=Deinococcus aquiradiocola TaxID=393059 RepID=A0A917PJG2_9DEIO|nr:aminoacyl-tRNA hydrolase [Deinococcus aquiradiocola]GGJ81098.1 peptidyl-tRNA hydrolase [Deinococcus aquiradiocola]